MCEIKNVARADVYDFYRSRFGMFDSIVIS